MWETWRKYGERPAQILVLAAAATSFLSAAATVRFIYTLQPSYVLAIGGVVLGAPRVVAGWRNASMWLRVWSVMLVAVYLLSMVAGHPGSVSGSLHTGRSRELVYMADLCVGLATVALINGLWAGREVSQPMASALAVGGALAGAYAVYQWFGLHFHWPFIHVNNTLDSNGVSSGESQGVGLFGWERTQGTFLEPHFLGAYLACVWPVCVGIALGTVKPWLKRCLAAIALLMLAALLTTDSVPAWASLLFVCIACVGVVAVSRGKPVVAALAVSSVIGVVALVPVTGIQQGAAATTGRTAGAISSTTQFRTATWFRAIDLWAQLPILGAGPGQASVRLTVSDKENPLLQRSTPGVLLSSQGLWAAALLDAGLLGFAAWLLFLGGVIYVAARGVFRSGNYRLGALLAAALIAVIGNLTAGDRLELWAWLILGSALAAASSYGPRGAASGGRE